MDASLSSSSAFFSKENLQVTTTLTQLGAMSAGTLDYLYSVSTADEIPNGESNGKAIVLPGTLVGGFFSWLDNIIWKGKIFQSESPTRARLINKILGMHLVRAEVFFGPSWTDGRQSVIIDYRNTSWIAFFIRDEIRKVEDGLYLGKAYIRLPFGGRLMFLYFALDFRV